MPNVDGKQFGYGPKGKKAAKKYAKKHGLEVKHKDNPGYYAESFYNKVFNKLIENASEGYPEKGIKGGTKAAEKESRNVRRARLRNKETGSMLTRKNQRRLTKMKAKIGSVLGLKK